VKSVLRQKPQKTDPADRLGIFVTDATSYLKNPIAIDVIVDVKK